MSALERAVEIAGSQAKLAAAIGVTQSNVWYWLRKRAGVVPVEYLPEIERATNFRVTRKELRPDVFE